ncbi:hypothetical protein TCDM_10658 [Trypanosoma cruzi Dm28c]|uniref:Uncharacterized protein n=1 Tax=Trypanosoma cruzi Dm28c TaxID=1416333 RepID=V5BBH5_TRYCR|nr:hypothetical protein TCDM_10658 [Trypanosoma cruzi Dm28c]
MKEVLIDCPLPHTLTVTITVSVTPSFKKITGMPRSPAAHVVHRALPLRRNVRHLSVKQLRVHHGSHNRRHALAAQHTQRHNVVPPLLHNHECSAQRVLAHVLHALQPPADQAGRHALHFVVLLLHEADPPSLSIHGLGAARDCREVPHVWKIQTCGNNGHFHSITHLRSLHSPTHKGGVMGKRCSRHSAYTRAHAIATPYISHRKRGPCAEKKQGNERRASNYIPQSFSSVFHFEAFSTATNPTENVRLLSVTQRQSAVAPFFPEACPPWVPSITFLP